MPERNFVLAIVLCFLSYLLASCGSDLRPKSWRRCTEVCWQEDGELECHGCDRERERKPASEPDDDRPGIEYEGDQG